MKLIIEIELGNEAMRNSQDVKDCLLKSRLLEENGQDYQNGDAGLLKDINGNRVGFWQIKQEPYPQKEF